ncbi:MAG TPA: alkaline phosphatase family protein [Natronosporangium sp.]
MTDRLVRPAYGDGSLADLLPSLLAVLGMAGATDRLGLAGRLAGVRRIAVLLVDGLGHQLLPVAGPVAPVLADLTAGRLGALRPITTGFPSTTPTSLTSLGTGAPPGVHGLLGFRVSVPGTGRVLNHIEWTTDPDPRWWQPLPTQLALGAAAGISVTVVSRSEFVGSGLTESAWRGAAYRPADDLDALADRMLAALTTADPPALVYGYHRDVDRAGHRHGVDSPAWRAAVAGVDQLLDRLIAGLPADAALVVTADHGQLNVPEDARFDLDTDPRLSSGVDIVAGEPRVRYLHTVPGAVDDVIDTWREVLGEAAWVARREEVIAAGWFGPVSEAHLARIGDVVVVCRDRYVVLASVHEPPQASELVAYHGSWTAAEMLVPLIIVRGSG